MIRSYIYSHKLFFFSKENNYKFFYGIQLSIIQGLEEDSLNSVTKENMKDVIVKEKREDNETEVGVGDSDQANTAKTETNADEAFDNTPKSSSQGSHKISTSIKSFKDDFDTPMSSQMELPTPCRKDSRPSLSCLDNRTRNQSQSPVKILHKEFIVPITTFELEDKENSQELNIILTPDFDNKLPDSQEVKPNGESKDKTKDNKEEATESSPEADLPVPDKIEVDDDPTSTVAKLEAIFKRLGAGAEGGGKRMLKISAKKSALV